MLEQRRDAASVARTPLRLLQFLSNPWHTEGHACDASRDSGSRVDVGRTDRQLNRMSDLLSDWRYRNFRETDRALHFRQSEFHSETHGDHDHCIGCWQKFASGDFPDAQHDGYVARCFDQNRWACRTCWIDFRELMGWTEEGVFTL